MRNVYSGLLLIFKWGYLFSCYCVIWVSYILWQRVPSQMHAVQMLPPALWVVSFLWACCCTVQSLWGSWSSLILALLWYMHLRVISKNSLFRLMLFCFSWVLFWCFHRLFYCFWLFLKYIYSRTQDVSLHKSAIFQLKSLWIDFLYGMNGTPVLFSARGDQFFPTPCIQETFLYDPVFWNHSTLKGSFTMIK